MTTTKPLSARQTRILDFIRAYKARHGIAPRIRDIMAGADISSTSVAEYNLKRLEEAGCLRLLGGESRRKSGGIVLADEPAAHVADYRALLEDHAENLELLAAEVYGMDPDTLYRALTARAEGLRAALATAGTAI